MIGAISDALISRASARISETAPGRTPIAAARPPLVLPGFSSPRSIILIFSMAPSFPNFRNDSNSDYPKSSFDLISEYQKLNEPFQNAPAPVPESRDDHTQGDSRCASSTRPGMTQLHASDHTGIREAPNAIDELDTGAFKRVAGAPCQGHVLFRRPRGRSTPNSTTLIPETPRS